ncbi:MAG: site-specific DNA-methyltransferase [Propionibacteriaceae bacterium]|nr:site-specific DNA-methyltransferase [Propionibacteriaceae bacterium]
MTAPARVHLGDCIDVMAAMPDQSVDAVVTDPPYAIGIMSQQWDRMEAREFEAWCERWARECHRLLKPGGYLAAFGSARTWHRLAAGIEDAGFNIRDGIAWIYAQGYPPSIDVTEAVEAFHAEGPSTVEPEAPPEDVLTITRWLRAARDAAGWTNKQIDTMFGTNGMAGHWTSNGTQPAIPRIDQWDRLRDALGFDDTEIRELVEQLAATRTWVPGQRKPDERRWFETLRSGAELTGQGQKWGTRLKPAFEPIVLAQKPPRGTITANVRAYGTGALHLESDDKFPTNVAIAEGVDVVGVANPADYWHAFRYTPKAPSDERPTVGGVIHPTPKPLALMQWLVDLITPTGGIVLDPFAGSGSTGVAALMEGRTPILIEREPQYVRIIEHRLAEPIQPSLLAG